MGGERALKKVNIKMGTVIHKTTKELKNSVDINEYDSDWIKNPSLPNCDKKYWKIVGETVQEMSQAEKDVIDAAVLQENIIKRKTEVDTKTQELILKGFEFDDHSFSLSIAAQSNWTNIKLSKDILEFPFAISTKENGEYLLQYADVDNFYLSGLSIVKTHYDSGRALKVQINACTTQSELDAIVDDRT